ncbi:MAG: hypothetical protein G01um10147_1186 [Microgenomates group bacterium Gr01-1014_7]|nr:MAG: hypothetical protein G01um10147_1186 [Microgenomates group bacterium Gr01-1014_7]
MNSYGTQGWLNEDLKKEIKKVFEPRYKRSLTGDEVTQIAENLTDVMEAFLKMKWKQKYGQP